MTTTVVAQTSRRVGHVTRPSSLRTSLRNRRARPNHPATCSGDSLRLSSIAAFIFYLLRGLRPRTPYTLARGDPFRPAPLAWLTRSRSFACRPSSFGPLYTLARRRSPSRSVGRSFYCWQARRDSNPQPSVLETDALPVELLACNARFAREVRTSKFERRSYFDSLCAVCFRQYRQNLLN